MDLISKTLHYLGKNFKNLKAIQIGAMDGINFDDTRGFFNMYEWETILVEPIPEIFEELKQNLKDQKNLYYENVAIGSIEGTIKMLTIPNQTIIDNDLHPGYKGMSAVYPLKNGFGSDYQRDIEVKAKYGVDIEVPCITFDTLVKKYNFNNVDILICDAEGYDWEIFKTIDLDKYNFKFIRLEYVNLNEKEKSLLVEKLKKHNYIVEINFDIDAVKKEIYDQMLPTPKKDYTIVSGLWDISRIGRDFNSQYIPRFKEFLHIDAPMILFLPEYLHEIVWEIRKPEDTFVKTFELSDIQHLYSPHWDQTQKIRTNPNWYNITGENGWLKSSPQALNEWYNPIVQSKMFMLHDASIYNTFNTEYFYWLDAGITNTVPSGHLVEDKCLDTLTKHTDPFLFLSYPYAAVDEIHGFKFEGMNRYATKPVKYVCRGGLFGGHKDTIREANSTYYSLLSQTLSDGLMGTEESLFAIMAVREPHLYKRFMLDENGLIVKFTEALLKNNVKLEELPLNAQSIPKLVTQSQINNFKTNLYILTFNFPEQVLHTINSMKKVPEWLEKPHLVLLDNSTDENAKVENQKIAKEYNFEYIHLGNNIGICGGRQAAAEHFHNSDADFYFFFEDDMTVNPPEFEGQFCRNGFRKYIPNLYNILHKIILKEDFDFLKFSFTEVYWDNNIQTSWYNVPQDIRTRDWPHYDKLPINGSDPNAPRTQFGKIDTVDGVAYIDGEVTYTNWPMIMSKKGNQRMFIDTKWAHPFEQTWMSYAYQLTKEGNFHPAVLLASPIWHERIKYYKPEERREN